MSECLEDELGLLVIYGAI